MTVSTTSVVAGPYTGNGVTTTFDYNWTIWKASELILYQTDTSGNVTTLTEGTDYTVNGIGSTTGRNVTLTNPLPTGYTLLIKSNFVPTQETDFVSQGAFYPQVHEDALDKLTYLIQQLVETDSRALTLSPDITGIDTTVPKPEAGYLIGWDSPADRLTNIAPGSTVINVGATAPDPTVFPLWYDTNVSGLKYYNGSTWVSVDATGKADKVAGATAGSVPTLDSTGNLAGELIPGAAHGIATLDANGDVPTAQLPAGVANGMATLDGNGILTASQLGVNSLNGSGYQKLPGGLIVQWGTIQVTSSAYVYLTFPIAFPNACFSVVATSAWISGLGYPSAVVYGLTKSNCQIGHSLNGTALIKWLAVGY